AYEIRYAQAIDEVKLQAIIQGFLGIARALGVRFVWVDAYCILQDNDDNKHREVRNMGEIYKNSLTYSPSLILKPKVYTMAFSMGARAYGFPGVFHSNCCAQMPMIG